MLKEKEKLIFKSADGLFEICELPEGDLAGRKKIKMTALKIDADRSSWNQNGITWLEQYVNDNLPSIIGAPYVVSWLISKEDGIPSDHGRQSYDDEGNVQFEGDTVGSIQNAYMEERTINDVPAKVLTTEGYLYMQRYPEFIKWLTEQVSQGTIYGSIEINGKGKNKNIGYLDGNKDADGNPKISRVPIIFDFSGLAILSSFVQPADDFSQVIELNSKKGEGDNSNMSDTKITIDNSKDSAVMSGEWNPNDGEYFRKIKSASNAKSLFKEGYLEVNISAKIDDIIEADCKYPHHEFVDNKMVVSKPGCEAAEKRLAANDPNNVKAKHHIAKHFRELGLELSDFLKSVETNSTIKNPKTVEINELNYDDIATIVTKAFNVAMIDPDDADGCYGYNYYIYRFYPVSGRVIMAKWDNIGEYYMTTYNITNSEVTIGEIVEVEEDWTPVDEETEVEVNTQQIRDIINKKNKEVKDNMDDKVVLELNKKVEDKTNEINTLNKTLEAKTTEVNSLNTKIADLDKKVAELNSLLVEANKSLESEKSNKEKLETEVNVFRAQKADDDAKKAKAEVSTYFDAEIIKNGFDETELNSLKEFVEKSDLVGLKNAEQTLCAKKFKELKDKTQSHEINSLESTLLKTKEVNEKDAKKKIPTFFN